MVERFTPCDWPHATMVEDSDGGYVSYYDYEKLQQRLATVDAVSRNRLETILLIHGCYFDACSEAESILSDLSKAEAERDQWQIDAKQLQSTLRVVEDENSDLRKLNNELRAERDRLKEAIKEFSDKWKYYDSKTITGLDDLRTALREVDGGKI